MFDALLGRAKLGIGKPDVLDAVVLAERLDLLRDLGRLAITLVFPLDLVVEAEMALQRAAALGVDADIAVEVVAKVREDRVDVREVDGREPAQI